MDYWDNKICEHSIQESQEKVHKKFLSRSISWSQWWYYRMENMANDSVTSFYVDRL